MSVSRARSMLRSGMAAKRTTEMTCDEREILLHALIDGELDAGHARKSRRCRRMPAPAPSPCRLSPDEPGHRAADCATPPRPRCAGGSRLRCADAPPSRRAGARGFAMGSAVSALAATGLVAIVRATTTSSASCRKSSRASAARCRPTPDRRDLHRSAYGEAGFQRQARRIAAGDRSHAQGFTLAPAALDYVDARAIGAVVYRRRQHVINTVVAQTPTIERRAAKTETIQGFKTSAAGAKAIELFGAVQRHRRRPSHEFGEKFQTAMQANRKGAAMQCAAPLSLPAGPRLRIDVSGLASFPCGSDRSG